MDIKEKPKEIDWIAPKNSRLPDFIICGAMKCGTTTVHALLNQHPQVYIPKHEINFFDIDDIFQHSDFFHQKTDGRWIWPNLSDDPKGYWKWYDNFFAEAPENCIMGEDSTCYLASARASTRIALQPKAIKIILCLRQPTLRAYSQYWHMLRTGRALFNFEDTIKFTPSYVLDRSMYLSQILEFMKNIPRERIFFFVLEEFLGNQEGTLRNLSQFLSLNYDDFPQGALSIHENKARIPRSAELQAIKNRMLRSFGNMRYTDKLPFQLPVNEQGLVFARIINKLHDMLNPSEIRAMPKMNDATKDFLDNFFRKEIKGLGDIVGTDLDTLWFGDNA